MIRVEVVIKAEARVVCRVVRARSQARDHGDTIAERADLDDLEIVRIQFLGPKR